MKKLYVLYDSSCGLCVKAAAWLARQPVYLDLETIPAGSHKAHALFPNLTRPTVDELIVVADSGEVYEGTSAWLMCLYALRAYRVWSFRLATPAWRPLARRAITLLSQHRKDLSRLLGWSGGRPDGIAVMAAAAEAACAGSACADPSTNAGLVRRVRELRSPGPQPHESVSNTGRKDL